MLMTKLLYLNEIDMFIAIGLVPNHPMTVAL